MSNDPQPVTRDPLIAHRDPRPTTEVEKERLRKRARALRRKRRRLIADSEFICLAIAVACCD